MPTQIPSALDFHISGELLLLVGGNHLLHAYKFNNNFLTQSITSNDLIRI